MTYHVLNFFNDNRGQNVRFAEFDDETVVLRRGSHDYRLFGAEFESAFIERLSDGAVLCDRAEADPSDPPEVAFVNSHIVAFARCRAFFDALVMRRNAEFMPYASPDKAALLRADDAMAGSLGTFVAKVDPPAMDGDGYWPLKVFRITDCGLVLNPGIEFHSRRGRVARGES